MTKATGERIGSRMDGNRWPPLPLMDIEKVIEATDDPEHKKRQRVAGEMQPSCLFRTLFKYFLRTSHFCS
ncbi:MAG: hypothetical protein O3A82_05365 [Verrucomicrobia bacterium]|jgi:hypothetical protein|nr:hypothetical protein [Verrucomicrobiota bacterium]